jgi:hypothetical protein
MSNIHQPADVLVRSMSSAPIVLALDRISQAEGFAAQSGIPYPEGEP